MGAEGDEFFYVDVDRFVEVGDVLFGGLQTLRDGGAHFGERDGLGQLAGTRLTIARRCKCNRLWLGGGGEEVLFDDAAAGACAFDCGEVDVLGFGDSARQRGDVNTVAAVVA